MNLQHLSKVQESDLGHIGHSASRLRALEYFSFTFPSADLKAFCRLASLIGIRTSACPSVVMSNDVSASAPSRSSTGFSITNLIPSLPHSRLLSFPAGVSPLRLGRNRHSMSMIRRHTMLEYAIISPDDSIVGDDELMIDDLRRRIEGEEFDYQTLLDSLKQYERPRDKITSLLRQKRDHPRQEGHLRLRSEVCPASILPGNPGKHDLRALLHLS